VDSADSTKCGQTEEIASLRPGSIVLEVVRFCCVAKPCDRLSVASLMFGRLQEGMDLPHFVRRQAQVEGRRLLALADHALQKTLVAEFSAKRLGRARAGAVVPGVALDG
jgi:hypothetical protein